MKAGEEAAIGSRGGGVHKLVLRLTDFKLGALWMVVASFLFACMGVFVKLGAQHFSSAEMVLYRSLFGLVMVGILARSRGVSLATPLWRTHAARSVSGFVALMLFFHAISTLPLATAITLNYTAPLFLAFLTALVLRERLHRPLIVAIVLGFAGVVLLLRPTIQQHQLAEGLVGLASGFLAGVAYLNVKQLGRHGEPEIRTVFYFTLVSSVGGGLWMLLKTFHPLTLTGVLLLLGLGTTATLAQLAMTRAYRQGHTLTVGSFAYSTVVFASLWGIVLWDEVPGPASWAGMALIVLSGLVASRAAPRLAPT